MFIREYLGVPELEMSSNYLYRETFGRILNIPLFIVLRFWTLIWLGSGNLNLY